jgi:hypothetical protein
MKKIAYFIASAAAFAILFTACNPETVKETVETVEVVSVVPETTNENAQALPEGDEGKDLFEESVLPSITTSITTLATSVKDSSVQSSNTRGLTFTDLSEAFEKFPESFKSDVDQTTGSMSFAGSWDCPTGELDFGSDVKGLSASINALSVKIDAKYTPTVDVNTVKYALGATGSAKAAASLAYEDSESDLQIKKAKMNLLGYSSLNAAAVLNALESYSGSGNTRDADTTDVSDYTSMITEYLTALETLTGNIALYMGNSGAFYFEVPVEVESESVTYNGVAKVDYSINANKAITKDVVEGLSPILSSLTEFMNSADDSQETETPDYTELLAKLDELELAEISYTFSVYDVEGTKLFDLYDVHTFAELADIIPSMMALTASFGAND